MYQALVDASAVTAKHVEQLSDHLTAHKKRAAYAESAVTLREQVLQWHHSWLARMTKVPANGRALATLESQAGASEGLLEDATVHLNNQQGLVDRLEAKLNEGTNNEQLAKETLQMEESRLASKEVIQCR